MTAISIIMPCYNRAYDLARVLARYDEQDTQEPFELIAVDDASADRTYELLCSYAPRHYRLRVLRHDHNQGPAAARNLGIANAQSPLVAFVGDDILPERDFVRRHIEAHQRFPQPETAILGKAVWGPDMPVNSLMDFIDGKGAQQFSYFYMVAGREYDFRHLYTCNVSLKRALLLAEPRWFDTDFPYAAFEDAELGYRLAKHGLRILYQPEIVGYHYHYHTIWSFSTRQFVSGLSSRVMVQKHPELKSHPTFRGHYRRLATMLPGRILPGQRMSEARAAGYDRLACHLASFYEWLPDPNLRVYSLYALLLDYFYYNGVLKADLGDAAYEQWAHGAHARAYLLPALQKFINLALTESLPLPPGVDQHVR